MTNKKKWIKKVVYAVLFIAMIGAFIYLSEKYKSNADDPVRVITDYYDLKLDKDRYTIITGGGFINLIQHGRSIIIVGSKTSSWSKEFVKQLDIALTEAEVDQVYYYDINNDKSQKNSNYYKIKELLNGSLTTTDGSKNNLLAPSLYIIIDGEVKYYNVDTVAMKNTIQVEDYWKEEKKLAFRKEVKEAITKYYLNN